MGSVNLVTYGKINIPTAPNIKKYNTEDGSFICEVWDRERSELKLELKKANCSSYDSAYSAYGTMNVIPTVEEKILLYTVVITKKSSHNFNVMIIDKKSVTCTKCTNYEEVNVALTKLSNSVKKLLTRKQR